MSFKSKVARSFVSVNERVIFDEAETKPDSFFQNSGIKFNTAKTLKKNVQSRLKQILTSHAM